MAKSIIRKLILGVVCLSVAAASAQNAAPAPAAQTNSQDAKIRELEDRIIQLENIVRELKSAQGAGAAAAPTQAQAAAPTAAAPTEVAAAPAPAPQETAPVQTGGATSMAKALNPDISVIGDFLGSAGHNPIAGVPSLEMHESEVGFQAIIDPYARGDFFISFGETGVNLEEGYITFTALPAGIVARVGKMRAAFGKVNTLHNHVLPWTDRPMVTDNLVAGEDGINDAGFSVVRSFNGPKGVFLEGTGQVFRGDTEGIFVAPKKSNVSVVGHFRGYKDITESTNLDLGVSYARGTNNLSYATPVPDAQQLTNLYGVDATLRWKPLRRAIYHSFIGRSEFIWNNREGYCSKLGTGICGRPDLITQNKFGYYASGDYQLGRRWFLGARYDSSDRFNIDTFQQLHDRGGSLVLTYWPTEFSQLRAQYRAAHYAENITANELRFQVQFSLGAHGAHPF